MTTIDELEARIFAAYEDPEPYFTRVEEYRTAPPSRRGGGESGEGGRGQNGADEAEDAASGLKPSG